MHDLASHIEKEEDNKLQHHLGMSKRRLMITRGNLNGIAEGRIVVGSTDIRDTLFKVAEDISELRYGLTYEDKNADFMQSNAFNYKGSEFGLEDKHMTLDELIDSCLEQATEAGLISDKEFIQPDRQKAGFQSRV